jgi:WhiB family redox-sensing transcriptional regulator
MGAQIVNFRPSGEQSWARSAECAKPGQPLMFPHEGDADGVKLARDVCNVCPVRQQCLDEALGRNESFGIWGGLTTDERRALRRKAARAAAVQPRGTSADEMTASDPAARTAYQDTSPITRPRVG